MVSESESSSDGENDKKKKLGDRLFDDDTEAVNKAELKSMAKQIDPKLLKQLIEKESPELQGLLQEFQESLETLNKKLHPVLEKANSK